MRAFVALLVLATFIGFDVAFANSRCKRGTGTCQVRDADTGLTDPVDYEDCTHFCCGNAIYERDVYFECCGNVSFGIPYNPVTQFCCTWQYGGEFSVHDKTNETDGAYCCGVDLFQPSTSTSQSCCNGWKNRPEIFAHRTEMCCGGNRQFAGDTAYTSCCGDTSYDRRTSSCPCYDGVIGVGIPMNVGGCCYSNNGLAKSPYNTETEQCCDGVGYNKETHFCCGTQIGNFENETCCGNVITSRSADLVGVEVGCCVLADGTTQVYNTATSICCGNSLQQRDSGVEGGLVCCGDTVYNTTVSGDECCGNLPYFTSTSACCVDGIGVGDSCCDGVAYSSIGQICCDRTVSTHDFNKPGCCVNSTFDADTQTCCGSTIYENPLLPDGQGGFVSSHHTRCCGNFADDDTLLPYDYLSQVCCGQNIVDLNDLPLTNAQCCGTDVIDYEIYSCCDGNRVENIYGDETGCCGQDGINTTSTICCNGVTQPLPVDVSPENAVCCGNNVMDTTQQKCCNDIPRRLNGVPPAKAICCGNGCIDGTTYWCCDGKQYQKGATSGVDVSGLRCDDLFGSQ